MLTLYIAAYLECLRRVLDPLNHKASADILIEDLGTAPDIADEAVALLRRPGFGLHPTAAIDEAGVRNIIALRASQHAGSRFAISGNTSTFPTMAPRSLSPNRRRNKQDRYSPHRT